MCSNLSRLVNSNLVARQIKHPLHDVVKGDFIGGVGLIYHSLDGVLELRLRFLLRFWLRFRLELATGVFFEELHELGFGLERIAHVTEHGTKATIVAASLHVAEHFFGEGLVAESNGEGRIA